MSNTLALLRDVLARYRAPVGISKHDALTEIEAIVGAEQDDLAALTKTERSILLYAETCVVDYGGLLEGQRMNADDVAALKAYQDKGILTFGRIPFHTIEEVTRHDRKPTHWVTFTDRAWQMAHGLRRLRAETSTSALRQKVDAALAEREPAAA